MLFTERHRPHPLATFTQELSYSLLGYYTEQKQRARKLWSAEARQEVTSGHKNWDNTSYCRGFSCEAAHQYTFPEFLRILTPNFMTITDEYCLGTPKKTYQYTMLHNQDGEAVGSNGLDNAYQEKLERLAQRFQVRLNAAGKLEQRGELETYNSHFLDEWITDTLSNDQVPIGNKLVWCSPPGHLLEGYHGVSPKHHSFIWVYEKKVDAQGVYMEMTQFRCWPNLTQMENIQHTLSSRSQRVAQLSPLPTEQLTRRNTVIAHLIELGPDTSIEEVESTIYKTEPRWQVKRTDMPATQMTSEQLVDFEYQRQRVLDRFLIPIYEKLLGGRGIQLQLSLPYDNPFWTSDLYRERIAQLDLVFGLAKQALDKWIEDQLEDGSVMTSIDLHGLQELYTIGVSNISGGVTDQERERYNLLAPSLISVGNRLLSIGQCGIGTIVPINLLQRIGNLSHLKSAATSVGQLRSTDLAQLTTKEKRQFKADVLDRYRSFDVPDRQGTSHRFWVLKEYYKDYVGHCYQDDQGVFRGPCDVPLTDSDDEFILTDRKYQELLAEANRQGLTTNQELERLQQEEAKKLAAAQTDYERAQIKAEFERQRKHLLRPSAVEQDFANLLLMYSVSTLSQTLQPAA